MHYAYILRSLSDPDKLYYGSTADLKKRFATHNAGGNISTKPFRPWEIAWYAGFPNQQTARDFEKYLKTAYARHLPKSVYSMPMNHDSFIWVGVLAFQGWDENPAHRAMGLNASFACSEISNLLK